MRSGIAAMIGLVCAATLLHAEEMQLQFDGGDRVVVPNSISLNPTEITVECRVLFGRLADGGGYTPTDAQHLVCKGNDRTPGAYRLSQGGTSDTEHHLVFNVGMVGEELKVLCPAPLVTERWYHVAGSYDGSDISLYLDGEPIGSEAIGPVTVGNDEDLFFSYHDVSGFDYYLTGQLDDVRIWDHARTQLQIQATMGAALTGAEPGLVGCWNFNEAADDQNVYDLGPNANNGLLGSTAGVDPDDPTRVPEPASLALLGCGAAALIRRRR